MTEYTRATRNAGYAKETNRQRSALIPGLKASLLHWNHEAEHARVKANQAEKAHRALVRDEQELVPGETEMHERVTEDRVKASFELSRLQAQLACPLEMVHLLESQITGLKDRLKPS